MSKKTKISWFKVGRKEMDMILKGGLGRRKYTVWAVYIRLLDLVNRNQSTEFEIHAGFIESLTGTSRNTTFQCLRRLEDLGLIRRTQNRKEGHNQQSASTYELPYASQYATKKAGKKVSLSDPLNGSLSGSFNGTVHKTEIKEPPKSGSLISGQEHSNTCRAEQKSRQPQVAGHFVRPW